MKVFLLKLFLMATLYSAIGLITQTLAFTLAFTDDLSAQKVQSVKDVNLEVEFQNEMVKDAFLLLEEKTDFVFVYDKTDNFLKRKVILERQNLSVEKILLEISKQTKLSFRQVNNSISVRKITNSEDSQIEVVLQIRTVKGKVTAGDGEGLPGVNVIEKGTTNGTITDVEGSYSLDVDPSAILVFSSVGFLTKEIPVGNKSIIDVSLDQNVQQLDELVVVGYGTVEKGNITGSVGSVKMDQELRDRPIVDFGEALHGKIPGVQVLRSSGKPGSSSTIQVRGINSISAAADPLIVVDGIPLPNYDLNMINANDIASIEVLKDAASAAIYGSRGGNGVILVTTKTGTSGKPKINVNFTSSIQKEISRISVMDGPQYARAAIDAAQNAWIDAGGDPSAPNTLGARGDLIYTWPTALENPENLPNTDWQDLIFRNAPMNEVDFNITGGTDAINYFFSAGFIDQIGVVINQDYNKYTINTKVDAKLNDWVTIGGGLNLVYDRGDNPAENIVGRAVQYPQIFPIYGENGYLGEASNTPGLEGYNNILFRARAGHPYYSINDQLIEKRINTLGSGFAKFNIIEGLEFRTNLSFYLRNTNSSEYQARDHLMGPSFYTEGRMSVDQIDNLNYNFQNTLDYKKKINGHQFSALLGMEYNFNNFYRVYTEKRGFENDLIQYLSAGQVPFEISDWANESALISYFSRLNYNYKGKYLLSLSFRRDGSSRFGPDKKWGSFPSVSAGWIVSDEPWLAGSSLLSNLKIRASYGLTGNNNFADYRWIGSMAQELVAFGNNLQTSYYPSGITNPDLAWERTRQFNVGINVGFFGNRLMLTGDYYRSRSADLLLDVPVPYLTGFNSVFQNIGELENRGVELNITSRNLTGALQWSTQFNISRNRNEIIALGPDDAPMYYNVSGGMVGINQIGSPVFNFFGYNYIGVYMNQEEVDADPASYPTATPGDGRYEDVNNDGVLNSDDRVIIGNQMPDFIWGLTNTFEFKNFDLSILFQGVHGNEVYDLNIRRQKFYHGGRNYSDKLVNRWKSPEDPGDGYHYKLTIDTDGYERTASSYWIADGSYIRLKSLTLGYSVPENVLERINLTSLRLFFNGLNLFTFTDADVFDVENFRGEPTTIERRGVNDPGFPTAKVFSLGLNVGF